MLEKVDLSKTMNKKELKAILKQEGEKHIQRACRTSQIPVMIVFRRIGGCWKRDTNQPFDSAYGSERICCLFH